MRYKCPPCPVCGKRATVTVNGEGYRRWHSGELIQHAFPAMTADMRELLISGTHHDCYNTLNVEDL